MSSVFINVTDAEGVLLDQFAIDEHLDTNMAVEQTIGPYGMKACFENRTANAIREVLEQHFPINED